MFLWGNSGGLLSDTTLDFFGSPPHPLDGFLLSADWDGRTGISRFIFGRINGLSLCFSSIDFLVLPRLLSFCWDGLSGFDWFALTGSCNPGGNADYYLALVLEVLYLIFPSCQLYYHHHQSSFFGNISTRFNNVWTRDRFFSFAWVYIDCSREFISRTSLSFSGFWNPEMY